VLALSVPLERLQAIVRRSREVTNDNGGIEHLQLSLENGPDVCEACTLPALVDILRLPRAE